MPTARFEAQLKEIIEWALSTGRNSKFQRNPWLPESRTEENEESDGGGEDVEVFTPLHDVGALAPGEEFSHLFGLDSQITILLSAIQAAADSDMHNRFHSLLWGPVGCGKTEILQGVDRLLQNLGINCLLLDATSTTEAGMRKNLLDEDTVPPDVILIEEIEKVPETSLRWLLGIMDMRATISQANYRKTASRKVPALILATANDMEQLKKMLFGALHSRFQHEIYCPRPGRQILEKILGREIAKVSGKMEWIEPTLRFCCDEHSMTDPRKIIPVCLCGKDGLLKGEYQRHLLKTMGPQVNTGVQVVA
jgi:hypothetical protein